jgi:hypothetical protein
MNGVEAVKLHFFNKEPHKILSFEGNISVNACSTIINV